MDNFNLNSLKRRTTDLLSTLQSSLPQSLPSMPSLPSGGGSSQHTLRGTWQRINGLPPLPCSSHSLDVVAGTAYIFGGEAGSPRQGPPPPPPDNSVHAVTLPFSGAGADYYAVAPSATRVPGRTTHGEDESAAAEGKLERKDTNQSLLEEIPLSPVLTRDDTGEAAAAAATGGEDAEEAPGDVLPAARAAHATAVIGSRIFVFGGRGWKDTAGGSVLEERGRVWVFDTKTRSWTYLDPAGPKWPRGRSDHAAVGVNKPDTFGDGHQGGKGGRHTGGTAAVEPLRRRAESWRDWAVGDTEETGIPQRPVVGRIAVEATDEDEEGFGTFIVHGGRLADGQRTSDTWAFDVRSCVWQQLPPAPGKPRSGAALCVSKSRMYRFGGFNGEGEEGGQLDVLDLVVDTFDDQVIGGAEATVTARGPWRSLVQFSGEEYTAADEVATAPLAARVSPADAWPGPRSVASFEALNVGGGREYLVLMLGERDPVGAAHAATGRFWDDVWVFQVPPQGMSAASLHDAVLQAVGRKSGEGKWTRVETRPWDDDDGASAVGPGPRGWIASAPMGELEENGIVVWGGLGPENKPLGDGWIFRLE